jgi:hypothetical protein
MSLTAPASLTRRSTVSTDPDVFELVIDRDAVVDYAGYQYAAYWQSRKITAGRYPVRVVTIHHGKPFTHDGPDQTWGKPYYALAELPAVVERGHADLEKPGAEVIHHVCAYVYQLKDGEPIVYARAEGSSPLPVPVGYFRKVTQA